MQKEHTSEGDDLGSAFSPIMKFLNPADLTVFPGAGKTQDLP